uniref:TPX2 central domain-containing protein n=1 Tax=Brassica campestris TaxID=3711 RepID=M4DS58_BRACM
MEYEFDAARWFDFTREESPAESQSAEFWFHSAPSYAPSPFVTKLLLGEDMSDDKTEASTKPEGEDGGEKDGDIDRHPYLNKTGNGMRFGVFSSQQAHYLKKVPNQPICKGPTVSSHNHNDKPKFRAKPSIRPLPRSSTLMKPTASQLAKQNNASKFHMQVDQVHEKGLCGTEVQAAKRQKLDGGLLRKVADTKPEMSFVHKIPKKIFDAPSLPIRKKSTPKPTEFQEFHLKTSERAMQHSSAVTTRSNQRNDAYKGSEKSNITDALDGINRESRRPNVMDISKHDVSEGKHVFKARPLNKKILSSRGDMGIFKNSKRETTVPLEFSFNTEKRVQPDLPTDLFSKLSIKPEIKQNSGSRTRFPQAKGFKENRVYSFQAGKEVSSKLSENKSSLQPLTACGFLISCNNTHPLKVTRVASGKTVSSAGHIQSGHSGIVPETNQQWTASRSLGIR